MLSSSSPSLPVGDVHGVSAADQLQHIRGGLQRSVVRPDHECYRCHLPELSRLVLQQQQGDLPGGLHGPAGGHVQRAAGRAFASADHRPPSGGITFRIRGRSSRPHW